MTDPTPTSSPGLPFRPGTFSTLAEGLDYAAVSSAVRRLFGRIERYEREVGLADVDPTRFVPSGLDAEPAGGIG